mgnify:CR=1 FL=1
MFVHLVISKENTDILLFFLPPSPDSIFAIYFFLYVPSVVFRHYIAAVARSVVVFFACMWWRNSVPFGVIAQYFIFLEQTKMPILIPKPTYFFRTEHHQFITEVLVGSIYFFLQFLALNSPVYIKHCCNGLLQQ